MPEWHHRAERRPQDVDLGFLRSPAKPGYLGQFGPYDVIEFVGQGGMGLVFKGHDPALNRIVAIKVLAPALATSVAACQRFVREAGTAAISHEQVVTIHAVDQADGLPYLVMQFVAGRSLATRIHDAGPMDLKAIVRIGLQMAAACAAAHAQGVVHRDVKPANILLENGVEWVKLTDFGLARVADDVTVTQTGTIAGTPQYMSPEQARDHRSDLLVSAVFSTPCAPVCPLWRQYHLRGDAQRM